MDEPFGGLRVGRTWVGEFFSCTKMSRIPRVPTREAMTLVDRGMGILRRHGDRCNGWIWTGLIPFVTMAMFVEFASDDELHLVVVVVACGGGSSAASTRVLPERMTMATMRPMKKERVADVLKAILVFCVCLDVC